MSVYRNVPHAEIPVNYTIEFREILELQRKYCISYSKGEK